MRTDYSRGVAEARRRNGRVDGDAQGWRAELPRRKADREGAVWRGRGWCAVRRCEFDRGSDATRVLTLDVVQRLEVLVSTLSTDAPLVVDILPTVFSTLALPIKADAEADQGPLEIPTVLIPPELDESDIVRTAPAAASSSGLRGDEGIGYEGVRVYLNLFDDEVGSPLPLSCACI